MSAKQWYLVRDLASLAQGNDGERAATARLPVDREILGVDLAKQRRARRQRSSSSSRGMFCSAESASVWVGSRSITLTCKTPMLALFYEDHQVNSMVRSYQVRIPCIPRYVQVVVRKLLSSRLPENVSCAQSKTDPSSASRWLA